MIIFILFNERMCLFVLVVILWTHTTWQVQFASSFVSSLILKFLPCESHTWEVENKKYKGYMTIVSRFLKQLNDTNIGRYTILIHLI